MAYYLHKERRKDVVGAYRRYQEYLRENQQKFPPGAFALGTSDWWYSPYDHRCPHDGWLETVTISEPSSGNRNVDRATAVRVRLLGAYHDGYIELFYSRVFRYQIDGPSCSRGLGDWRYDEFTLSPEGNLKHEIEWAGVPPQGCSRWIIEASDIEFQWIPK